MLGAQEGWFRHDQGDLLLHGVLDIELECIYYQNRPCKIVEMSTSKTGKHGHAKVHLVALDIFTGGVEERI